MRVTTKSRGTRGYGTAVPGFNKELANYRLRERAPGHTPPSGTALDGAPPSSVALDDTRPAWHALSGH